MTTARDIMTKDPITVSPETDIVQVATILLEKGINGVPVVDAGGKVLGILCQSDLIAQQKRLPIPSLFSIMDGFITLPPMTRLQQEISKIAATSVAAAMTPNPVTVTPDTELETIAALMVDKNFHTLPVVEGGRLVGIVGKEDVLRTLLPRP